MTEIKKECKTCKNPYCTRTEEERKTKEVQVHLQYGWECEDKEKYLQNDGGLIILKKEDYEKMKCCQNCKNKKRNTTCSFCFKLDKWELSE